MNNIPDIEKIKQTPMFFILGRPRTGSTLLRTLFDAHPGVIIPSEWPMLLLLNLQFGKVTFWDKNKLEEFYQALFQPLRIPYWSIRNWPGFDAGLLHTNIMKCEGRHTLETLIKVVYYHYNSFFPKGDILFIGDKNPAISNHPEVLARIFPEAKFIHLVRDYRDNLVSMLGVDFEMPNVTLLTYRWKHSFRVIEKAAAKYPGRFLRLRYEDLVRRPEKEFGSLCQFLGIPEDPSIFDFHTRAKEMEASLPPDVSKRYFSSLMQPIDERKVGVYKQGLTSKQVRIADLVAGRTALKAGYQRDSVKFAPAEYLWVAPAILYTKGLYVIGKLVSLLPFRWMLWLMNKPSVVVGLYTMLFKSRSVSAHPKGV
ncbi:MAG: sulfotransferase [Bacteroidota bacterium]